MINRDLKVRYGPFQELIVFKDALEKDEKRIEKKKRI